MKLILRFSFQRVLPVLGMVAAFAATSKAQVIRAPLDTGFVRTTSVQISVDEMLGSQKQRPVGEPIFGPGYPSLWTAELQYKPVRFVRMSVTDPATGRTEEELVWYMVYRYIQRDYTEIAGSERDRLVENLEDQDGKPANLVDDSQSVPIIVPRFDLMTDDDGPKQIVRDVVLPEVQRSIMKRELRSKSAGRTLVNSADAVGEIGEQVSTFDNDPLAKAVYGVAIWRNVNPDTDYFTIRMAGFTNAYKIVNKDGKNVIQDKVTEQKFGRPGDRYNQDEAEFRVIGGPEWKYVDRVKGVELAGYESILRNITSQTSFEDGQ